MLMTVSASRKFESFSSWFDDLIIRARIADNRFPVKGFLSFISYPLRNNILSLSPLPFPVA